MLDVDGIKIPIGFVLDQDENILLEFRRYLNEFLINLRLNKLNDVEDEIKTKIINAYEKHKTDLWIFNSFKVEEIDESTLNELKVNKKDMVLEMLNNPNTIIHFKIHEIQMDTGDNLNKLKEFIDDYLKSPESYPPILDKGFSISSPATAGSEPETENDDDN